MAKQKKEKSENEPLPTWQVWRQDENGQSFLVCAGLSQLVARKTASELESRGHKQVYWIQASAE